MNKEYKGQFPSKNCECHTQEPYGFVPEEDCPEHDTKQFLDFLAEQKRLQQEVIDKLIEDRPFDIKDALDAQKEAIQMLIVKEIVIAHKELERTSRLTSLANKVEKL